MSAVSASSGVPSAGGPAELGLLELSDLELTCVLRFLDLGSLLRFATTCKRCRELVNREDLLLWAPHCGRFGVTTLEAWGFDTYRQLYSNVLHRYGPLLGVWLGALHPLGSLLVVFAQPPSFIGCILACLQFNEPGASGVPVFELHYDHDERCMAMTCLRGPNTFSALAARTFSHSPDRANEAPHNATLALRYDAPLPDVDSDDAAEQLRQRHAPVVDGSSSASGQMAGGAPSAAVAAAVAAVALEPAGEVVTEAGSGEAAVAVAGADYQPVSGSGSYDTAAEELPGDAYEEHDGMEVADAGAEDNDDVDYDDAIDYDDGNGSAPTISTGEELLLHPHPHPRQPRPHGVCDYPSGNGGGAARRRRAAAIPVLSGFTFTCSGRCQQHDVEAVCRWLPQGLRPLPASTLTPGLRPEGGPDFDISREHSAEARFEHVAWTMQDIFLMQDPSYRQNPPVPYGRIRPMCSLIASAANGAPPLPPTAAVAGNSSSGAGPSAAASTSVVSLPATHHELEGLWRGTYGPHGMELLLVQVVGPRTLMSLKCTGDANVPAGKHSFRIHLDKPGAHAPHAGQTFTLPPGYSARLDLGSGEHEHGLVVSAAYHAEGQVAGTGHMDPRWIPAECIVFGPHAFGILWREISSFSMFRRVPLRL